MATTTSANSCDNTAVHERMSSSNIESHIRLEEHPEQDDSRQALVKVKVDAPALTYQDRWKVHAAATSQGQSPFRSVDLNIFPSTQKGTVLSTAFKHCNNAPDIPSYSCGSYSQMLLPTPRPSFECHSTLRSLTTAQVFESLSSISSKTSSW
jgi:hypothetical protein